MHLIKINEDKLTPFDLQVLNLTELVPGEWSLDGDSMYHDQLGAYGPSLLGHGLQLENLRNTPSFRALSWRGQLLLRRRHSQMLSSAVDTKATEERAKKNPLKDGPLGTSVFNHQLDALRYNLQGLRTTQDKLTATQMAQAQQDQMNLYRQQSVLPQQQAVAQPAVEMIFGHRVDELLQKGVCTAQEIFDLKKYAHTGTNVAAVEPVIAKLTQL